jgi:polyhydroxybutyrate depolymerase
MKQYFTLLLFALLFGATQAQLTQHSITVGTTSRNYYKYLPTGYQPTEHLPVVFILHGLGGNAQQMTMAGFSLIADTARVIAIYPEGLPNSFAQNSWNNGTLLSSAANDISFFNKMMDEMILNQNANPARIYVTGFSMGGIMSHHLACALNNRIAAIGPMAGTMSTSDISTCVPTYKTPVIHLHGTADGTVPYNSGALPSLSLVHETMAFWRNVHGCAATADSTRIPDTAMDGLTVDRFVYNTCDPLGSVELWRINGADHIYLYQPVNDITEAVEVWKFFNKWQHPNPQVVGLTEIQKEKTFTVYPNPSEGNFVIELNKNSLLTLMDMQGKIVHHFDLKAGTEKIQVKLTPGIYFLQDQNGATQRMMIR